ncbi:MAG: hypothetical protein IK078_11400 [Lachnospiraceae bacterium]|nr:hypothetical protein [Lachnospiraceae bacterium]
MRKQTRQISRVLITVIVAMLLGIMMVMPVFAKTKTVKPKNMYIKAGVADSTIIKKAAAVKTGTTKVVLPSKQACVLKFTAPKSKTYTFTFSGLTPSSNYPLSLGFFSFLTRVSPGVNTLKINTVKTQGGSEQILKYGSKSGYEGYLTSRYGKIKLNKGETAFVYVAAPHGKSVNCKIK